MTNDHAIMKVDVRGRACAKTVEFMAASQRRLMSGSEVAPYLQNWCHTCFLILFCTEETAPSVISVVISVKIKR